MRVNRREFIRTAGVVTAAGIGCSWRPFAGDDVFSEGPESICKMAVRAAEAAGAHYADVRLGRYRRQSIGSRDGRITRVNDSESYGFGVRVLVGGAWGFAASSIVSPEEITRVATLAVRIARASKTLSAKPVTLVNEAAHRARYISPRETDPFEVPLEQKVELLLSSHEAMHSHPDVRVVEAGLGAWRRIQYFASSEGAFIESDLLRSWGDIKATAVGGGDSQSRMYEANPRHAGWEHVVAADLVGASARVGREAGEKLRADEGLVGEYDLILDPSHLCLTLHETIGHPTELDRALGYEANYAGTSFLVPEKLGKLRYGSEQVNIVADNTMPVGLSTTGFDDDGVAGQRWDIVRDGVFVGYSTSREVAGEIGEDRSRGSSRADSWSSIPIVRIANMGLEPGDATVDELIADTKKGIYISGRGTWSIDQRRYNFQFGGDMFWLIENGERTRPLKNVIYQGITPEFWGACDGVCDESHWEPNGVLNCGKGEPGQSGQMTHGASHARFRKIRTGGGQEVGKT